MKTPPIALSSLLAASLVAACGGSEPTDIDGPRMAQAQAEPAQSPAPVQQMARASGDATPAPARLQPPAAGALASRDAGVLARITSEGPSADQVKALLGRYPDSVADEKSCPWGPIPCDVQYTAGMHQKFHGSVGWHERNEDGVHVDSVDLVQLPPVGNGVTAFIQNDQDSKDVVYVAVEDRVGTSLFNGPKLVPGAATTIHWTRTDDRTTGPFRLRLQAVTGPGDHTVRYTVLPLVSSALEPASRSARALP